MMEQMTKSVTFTVISKVLSKFLLNKLEHVTVILEGSFSLYSLHNPWHLMRQITDIILSLDQFDSRILQGSN